MESSRYPMVSILLPVRDEERHLVRCLDSILSGSYPADRMELLVIDGRSKDRSREIVKEYRDRYPQVRLLDNPRRTTPAALNVGIAESRGEILVWMGAHAEYDRDYVRRSVEVLLETGAAGAGGVIVPKGEGLVGSAIASAVSNPFGVGDARYRFATEPGWVDTVFGGCWRKRDVEAIGGFDEEWDVNQDGEFNFRLRKDIGGIWLSPDISCIYRPRNTLRGLASQYFRYGYWRAKTLLTHPESMRWRQLIPPFFVLALVAAIVMSIDNVLPSALLLVIYFTISLFMSLRGQKKQNPASILLMPLVFFLMHSAWGFGLLAGLFRHGIDFFSRS